ncbi:Uncharacterised protein [Serratia rubidaea]|uniref:Exc2 family lipoprotein n=1 Tax=Serratia rubidaea TaxID=61652 RepID=A0A3S4WVP4_SERRU|nr:Exc2 family lipoprotein [Serratia rubidaea]MBH1930409.1 Exc2 family lipoprotein [Serratia rubidaea]MDC6117508.1 Exc2 family lipoprotein [Serratia rubidaea]MEB7587857.1 Exc2 family lipoprotein [Serratia rubidaea]QPR64245.1 Exc2 family lipoprotein [Serratia rubidaea]CAI1064844.1 Uncharacterised protein [Serratia rubidaea]
MKRPYVILFVSMLIAALMTSACAPKTSVERHARQYVYAADEGFDPHFRIKKSDSARLMVPFFQQFREMGIKDRAAGVSRDEAMKRVSLFRSEDFLTSIQGKTTFAGRTYNDDRNLSPKERKAMGDAIEGTYLDGYEGRP